MGLNSSGLGSSMDSRDINLGSTFLFPCCGTLWEIIASPTIIRSKCCNGQGPIGLSRPRCGPLLTIGQLWHINNHPELNLPQFQLHLSSPPLKLPSYSPPPPQKWEVHVADGAKAEVSIDPYNNTYHCCKRCARKRQQTSTRYLPQEIVFLCLLHLRADVLHDVVRHVCREWSLIIRSPNFAHHHLRYSTILIQPRCVPRKGFYLEMRGGGCIETCEFDCGFNSLVWTSCNGLVVISDDWGRQPLPTGTYVASPSTKQVTVLPPSSYPDGHFSNCGLAFVEGSMVYKVVRACGYKSVVPKTQIAVLTIGVDKVWRHIDITHLLLSKERNFCSLPLVTGGYVHWVTKGLVLTLNVETEIVCRFSVPPVSTFEGNFLPMGNNLSFVSASSDRYFKDVWEMNSKTGEWTMLFRIKKRPINDIFKGMFTKYEKSATPLCWLAAREMLIFGRRTGQSIGVAYNVVTGEIQVFELESEGRGANFFHFIAHVNSLVWWE